MLYFAYGSNLHHASMAVRCPAATPIGGITLNDQRLVFRGVADVITEPGAKCVGGVWRITAECERALDRYEGIGRGFYRKEYIAIEPFEGDTQMLIYVMNSTGIMPPAAAYFRTIQQGYRDFRLPLKYLRDAVKASWDDKAPSHHERQRYRRNGRPELARIKQSAAKAVTTGTAKARKITSASTQESA